MRLDRTYLVHRLGAAVLGGGLLLFGIVGFAQGVPWAFSGEVVWGLSTNGVLSTISVVAALVLLGSAVYGGTLSSTVAIGFGVLFTLSGLAHLWIMNTDWNVLAFRLSNVWFSLLVGLALAFLGFYGRVSGGLPPENPYRRAHRVRSDRPDPEAQLHADEVSEQEQVMAEAEIAVAEGTATQEQANMVQRERARLQAENYRRAHRHAAEEG